jgi:flagellar FliL protein
MKSKLKFIVPIALVLLGGVYKFALAKPPEEGPKKVHGTVYVLPKDFFVNLEDDRFAKVSLGLVLDHSQPTAPAAGGHGAAAAPPEGYGTLEQEAVIRDIVTDTLTAKSSDDLIRRRGREKLKKEILREIRAHTDVKTEEVLLMDVAVQ